MPPKTSAENVIGRDHETDQPDEFAELAELTVQRGFRIAFFARGDGGSPISVPAPTAVISR